MWVLFTSSDHEGLSSRASLCECRPSTIWPWAWALVILSLFLSQLAGQEVLAVALATLEAFEDQANQLGARQQARRPCQSLGRVRACHSCPCLPCRS